MPPYHLAITALALAASLLCVPMPLAAQAASDILAAFQGTGDQLSNNFLARIFGCRLFPDGTTCEAQSPPIFAAIIGLFNLFSLALGMALFTWNASVGIMQTAHEGEVLGRRWNSLWAPVRTLTATAMLTPLPNMDGYNTIQVSIAFLVRGSTAAATVVWATASGLIINHQAPVTSPGVLYNVEAIASAWRAAGCRKVVQLTVQDLMDDQSFSLVPTFVTPEAPAPSTTEIPDDIGSGFVPEVPQSYYFATAASASGGAASYADTIGSQSDICGRIYMPDPPEIIRAENLERQWYAIHTEAYGGLQRYMDDAIASELVRAVAGGQALDSAEAGRTASNIITIGEWYHQTLEARLSQLANGAPVWVRGGGNGTLGEARDRLELLVSGSYASVCREATEIDEWIRSMCDSDSLGQGWLGAGAWYMHMARFANEAQTIFHAQPEGETVDITAAAAWAYERAEESTVWWKRIPGFAEITPQIENQLRRLADGVTLRWNSAALIAAQRGAPVDSRLIQGAFTEEGEPRTESSPRISGAVRDRLSGLAQDWFLPRHDTDPMAHLAEFGNALLAWGIGLAAGGALGGAIGGFVNLFPLGEIAETLGAVAVVVGGALAISGAFLAFILPLLPFLLWVAAVTGYFLLVAEAVIAVNLWAIAHLRLDGEGLAGEAARQGYYLVLALTLTPILMVFGFVIGMAIFKVTATLVGIGADAAIRGLAHDQSWIVWLFGMAVISILLVIVYTVMAERSFSLIAELPGRILRWIGADANVSSKEDDRIRATALGAARVISGTTSSTRDAGLGRSETGLKPIAKGWRNRNQDGGGSS